MNLVKRIYKQGIIILIALAALSAFFEWKKIPVSILLGGVLGLLNLKGLAWGLRDFATSARPSGKVVFFSLVRFFILAFILIILVIEKLVNPVGILIGFTVIFVLVLKEGLRIAKESSVKGSSDAEQ
jgi:hypothetical protein